MKSVFNSSKKLTSVILSVLLIITVLPVSVFAKKTEALPIATISDVHYYPQSLSGSKSEAYYTYLEGSSCLPDDLDAIIDASFESLKYQIEKEGLKYIVIIGDLTTNGEYAGHVEFASKLRKLKKETGCEIFVINGNHDINNYDASSFVNDVKEQAKITTPADFVEIYHEFGFDSAYHSYKKNFGDGTQGSLTYSIKIPEGYRFILADGGKYSSDATKAGKNSHETAGAFSEAQLKWILEEAEDAKSCGETPLLFTHWNMSGMNYFHEYLLQGFVIDDAYLLQETLADAGINYTFSGHQHVSDIDITYSDSGEPMYSVINPTLTQFPFAYRLTNFTKTDKGLKVDFNLCSVDEHSQVKDGDYYYEKPFRNIGYVKQYMGRDGSAEFLWKIVKKVLDNYMGEIRKEGSIIDFIEKKFDLNLERTLNNLINGGISINSKFTFTGKNIMNLLRDLDSQLIQKYINDKNGTYTLIKDTLIEVCNYELSSVPCTQFIKTYGFGDASKGGTLGDLLCSVLAYMYMGNEDVSDDAFICDILEQTQTTGFVDKIFAMAIEKIVKPLIVDEILANTDFNIEKLFPEGTDEASRYTGFAFKGLLSILDNTLSVTADGADIDKILNLLSTDLYDISFKGIIETVLKTGLIKYGTTIDELLYNLVEQFFDENNKLATAYQLNILADGMLKDADRDNNVTYYYNGPIKVTPTKDDMQLPSYITISYGKDASSSFIVTWFTKYTVKGSSLTFTDTNKGKVKTSYEETEFTGKGFDFGSFGILPWTEKVIKHTATVTGLEAGKTYNFKIGDKTRKFWSDVCSVTTASEGKAFTFLAISDSAAVTPEQGTDFSERLSAALNKTNASFIVHTGNIVREADNSDRWDYILNGCDDTLKKTPIMIAPGSGDGNYFANYLNYSTVSQNETSGLFYSYNYDNAHFVVVNPNNALSGGGLSGEQLRWLKNDLSSNNKLWTVLVVNDSLFCCDETNESLMLQLQSFIKEYNIDLILQGGNTYFARTLLMNGTTAVEKPTTKEVKVKGKTYNAYSKYEGYVAVCTGKTGSYINKDSEDAGTTKTYKNAGFVYDGENCTYSAVTISKNTLVVNTYSIDADCKSSYIDTVSINKDASEIRLGDINRDGDITVHDARLALRVALGNKTSLSNAQIYACHVTDNEKVKIADARLILRTAIKLGEISPETVTVSNATIKSFANKT